MANPFPFTAGQVLTAAQMNGIGETVSFTPTWSNITVGNGTVNYATYQRIQNLVYLQVQLTLGSTSSVTGNIFITAPLSPSNGNQGPCGVALFADVSAGTTFVGTTSMASGFLQTIPTNVASTYGSFTNTTSTIPMTWATGDILQFAAVYRVA